MLYAEVVAASYARGNDETFTYLVPDNLQQTLTAGSPVLVPFGPHPVEGIVFESHSRVPARAVKPIIRMLAHLKPLESWQLKLIQWMNRYYAASLFACLKCVVPFAFKAITPPAALKGYRLDTNLLPGKPGKQQQRLIHLLQDQPLVTPATLKSHQFSGATLKKAREQGWVSEVELPVDEVVIPDASPGHRLNDDQQLALNTILTNLKSTQKPVLLHGVTNSGKTEVYLQAVAEVLRSGGQAIILVPEIALTPQILERFEARFPGRVLPWHSHLSLAERKRIYSEVQSGRCSVVVGSRSALFTPFDHLKLIVIDEEQETSYKQEQHPRYHAVQVALQIAKIRQTQVVTGSATPTVESYYHSQNHTWDYVRLKNEFKLSTATTNKQITLVDMRDELRHNVRSSLSRPLVAALGETLTHGEQAMLFINRRGFATCVLCRDCGFVYRCPNCDLPLTYHQHGNTSLRCHHCLYVQVPQDDCPGCGSHRIRYLGGGTQKVMSEVARLFPKARLLRIDTDTIAKTGALQKAYQLITRHEVDIIVGTQLIVKGWDLPNVSLMGMVLADQSLYFPDYRSGERTFQLLTQAIGRAGRRDKPGSVIIQTYNPDNAYLQMAVRREDVVFYEAEISARRLHHYPPFTQLAKIRAICAHEKAAQKSASELTLWLNEANKQAKTDHEIIGPMPSFLPVTKPTVAIEFLLKGSDLGPFLSRLPAKWEVDIDPISLL